MALYNRKEFCKLLNFPYDVNGRAKIATWIKRGNIILSGEMIDDTLDHNKNWIFKQQVRNETQETTTSKPDEIKAFKKVEEKKQPKREILESVSLDKKLKEQQLEKLEVDTRLQLIKEEKLRGEILPVDLIKNVFTQHSQSILTEFKESIEALIIEFSAEKRLSGAESARLRGHMIKHLNLAIDRAVTKSQKSISSIVAEFTETRNPGEKINS